MSPRTAKNVLKKLPPYPEYRDSGVEWLPRVPARWIPKRLRFLCNLNPGKSEVSLARDDTEVSFLPMEFVSEEGQINLDSWRLLGDVRDGYTYFCDEDVLVAKITPCFENGKGGLCRGLKNGLGFGSTEFHVLRPLPGVNPEFVFYLTRSHPFRTMGAAFMTGAAGQKRVPENFIKDLGLGLPSPPEQRGIVAFLDRETARIDAMIAKKERLIALLEEKRQALISALVTGKLSIIEDPATGRPRAVDDAEFARLTRRRPAPRILLDATHRKPSNIPWLGDIPQHWEVKRLRHTARIQTGLALGKRYESQETTHRPYLRVANVQAGFFDLTDIATVTVPLKDVADYELRDKDILMTEGGDYDKLGRGQMWEGQIPGCLHQNHIFAIRTSPVVLRPLFFRWYLLTRSAKFYFMSTSSQTTNLATTNTTKLRNLEIPLPPVSEQEAIDEALRDSLDDLEVVRTKNREVVAKLQEHRSALITAAVTGQIDVRG